MSSNAGTGGAGQPSLSQHATGPPYFPPNALPGLIPSPLPDDPILAVLLALFVGSAIFHMTLFQVNLRRHHKFVFSVLLFGFSMARIVALSVRLAWAHHPSNTNIAIASTVLNAAGVLLLFVVNLLFAQRVVRGYHPSLGWSAGARWAVRALVASVIAVLVMVVTASVHLFFTADAGARGRDRQVQLFSATYLAATAFLPIPVVLLAWACAGGRVKEKFGGGSFRAKMGLLLGTSALLTLGAAFRAGTAFLPARPRSDPGWWHSKAAFYVFNFGLEIVVTWAYGLARFDRRFHVPDGCKGPGDYGKTHRRDEEESATVGGLRVNDDEDVFGAADKEGDASGGEETVVGEDTSSRGQTPPRQEPMTGEKTAAGVEKEAVRPMGGDEVSKKSAAAPRRMSGEDVVERTTEEEKGRRESF